MAMLTVPTRNSDPGALRCLMQADSCLPTTMVRNAKKVVLSHDMSITHKEDLSPETQVPFTVLKEQDDHTSIIAPDRSYTCAQHTVWLNKVCDFPVIEVASFTNGAVFRLIEYRLAPAIPLDPLKFRVVNEDVN